jgi:hypothetical protein
MTDASAEELLFNLKGPGIAVSYVSPSGPLKVSGYFAGMALDEKEFEPGEPVKQGKLGNLISVQLLFSRASHEIDLSLLLPDVELDPAPDLEVTAPAVVTHYRPGANVSVDYDVRQLAGTVSKAAD